MSLYVHLSEFRVTASAPRTQGISVPPLKLSVRSARAHARPLESSPATRLDDGSLDFPSWRVRWEERLPTQRSVLHLALIPDNKGRWRQRASCVPVRARASHPVAKAVLELSTLACGTVRRSVRIGPTAPSGVRYDISFDAVVEERANIRLTFKDVAVCSPFPLRSAYLVAAVQGQQGLSVLGSERHVHSAQPEWKRLPTLVLPKWGLAKLAHSVLVLRVHEAQGDNRCVGIIRIPMHDIWAAVLRKQYAAPFQGELQPLYSAGTDAVTPGSIRGFVHIDNVPRTGQMAGGVTTHSGMTGGRPIFCGVPLPYGDRIHGSTEDDGEDLPPHWIQLVDTFGYKYYYNIENSRNSWLRPTEERTVPNHTSGLGALGFERTRNNFYRSLNSGAETWVHPAATRIAPVTYSFDRTTRTAAGTGTESNNSVQQAPADSGSETNNNGTISCSSFSLDEPPSVRSLIGPQELSSLLGRSYNSMTHSQSLADNSERATLSKAEPVAQNANAIEEPMALLQATETIESEITAAADNSVLPNRGGSFSEEAAYTTEMKWVRLRLRGHNQVIPGPATQGHTFTAIGNGNTLLKFGGAATGNVKNNSVFEYNADQMYWRTLKPLGVPPVPRFGHGAVALGSDRSRLLVFGGSCRRGRLNDLHILHTETCAWSAVSAQGEPPGVRSRCGMTATSNGEIALVFGGRSIYRFLGGTYYDQKYVHAFHADRAQWYQIEPRGSVKGPAPRSGCVVEFVNDRQMFVHGGYDDGDEMYSDTFLFDLTSFSWQQLPYPNEPTEPCARESHTSTMVNGSVLIFGGVSERNAYLSDLHMFDPSRLRWVGPPSVSGYSPTGLCGAAMATVNDSQVVVTGGESGFTTSDEAFALDIARYPIADIDSLKERARARDLENMICVVCLDAKVDTMFLWCGHTVCCQSCAKKMESTCPVCRRPCAKIECINDL